MARVNRRVSQSSAYGMAHFRGRSCEIVTQTYRYQPILILKSIPSWIVPTNSIACTSSSQRIVHERCMRSSRTIRQNRARRSSSGRPARRGRAARVSGFLESRLVSLSVLVRLMRGRREPPDRWIASSMILERSCASALSSRRAYFRVASKSMIARMSKAMISAAHDQPDGDQPGRRLLERATRAHHAAVPQAPP